MTSKELVKRSIFFEMPEKIPSQLPLLYYNQHLERSDVVRVNYEVAEDFPHKGTQISEWGFVWERLDDTMGQPKHPPITDWEKFSEYKAPDPYAPGRFAHVAEFVAQNKEKFIIGDISISGMNFVTFLRGFQETMEDFYLEREQIQKLNEMVYGFEEEIIRQFCEYDIDAIGFGDDLGTQQSLLFSKELWQELYKPLYKRQFDLVHQKGKVVYFHCCGQVYDLIPDLIEIGVDVFNFNQPDLLGIEELGRDFGGKVCFCCPVDHQTVAIKGNRQEIFEYVDRLQKNLGCFHGGLIGYIEEYSSVGMSKENFESICEAFEEKRGIPNDKGEKE